MKRADDVDRLDRLESRFAIADLASRYCLGCDRRDLATFLSIWHEDGVYDLSSVFGRFAGSAGIEEGVRTLWRTLNLTRHWTTNLLVRFEGDDRAAGHSDATFDCEDVDGRFFHGAASYDDVYTRPQGDWKLLSRTVAIHYRKLVEAPDYQR